jgi:hypothetical protein
VWSLDSAAGPWPEPPGLLQGENGGVGSSGAGTDPIPFRVSGLAACIRMACGTQETLMLRQSRSGKLRHEK